MATQVAIIKKNYSRRISSYALVTLVLLAGAAYYSYLQYFELSSAQSAISSEQEEANVLQTSVDQFSKGYDEIKKAFATDFATTLDAVQAVYPTAENYTELTRTLDAFFQNTTTADDPLFASDLKFSQPIIGSTTDYATLPFTMTVSATKNSFTKFLQFVESSGSLDTKTRLLDIVSITINFPAEQEAGAAPETAQAAGVPAGPSTYTISLSMNAYFQKPATTPAQPAA